MKRNSVPILLHQVVAAQHDFNFGEFFVGAFLVEAFLNLRQVLLLDSKDAGFGDRLTYFISLIFLFLCFLFLSFEQNLFTYCPAYVQYIANLSLTTS